MVVPPDRCRVDAPRGGVTPTARDVLQAACWKVGLAVLDIEVQRRVTLARLFADRSPLRPGRFLSGQTTAAASQRCKPGLDLTATETIQEQMAFFAQAATDARQKYRALSDQRSGAWHTGMQCGSDSGPGASPGHH